ncbi:MAG: HypC/HybG/HupF family hydrogenase formation chaperone [Chloroflexi bacterium]|nr:HypC/HybG/HupF family hydrogenase formation chaperone [Chloroflexota bacterium]
MCLGIPGCVKKIYEQDGVRMGQVDFGGVIKEVCLAYVPETQVNDYVIVHAGFAISRLDEKEAQETLALLREMASLEDEADPAEDGASP